MKDISLILKRAVLLSSEYNSKLVSYEIEKISDIWCRLEDDSNLNWYLISRNDGKSVIEYYGYLSVKFPIAFLKKNCPDDICQLFSKLGILQEEYCESYSCRKDILKKYVEDKAIIDDRFLYDENIPFNEELFLKIDEGISYISPFNFTFDDLKQNV